jgi:hypothetical protein
MSLNATPYFVATVAGQPLRFFREKDVAFVSAADLQRIFRPDHVAVPADAIPVLVKGDRGGWHESVSISEAKNAIEHLAIIFPSQRDLQQQVLAALTAGQAELR